MPTSTTQHSESQSPSSDRPAQRLPVLDLTAQHHAGQLIHGRFDEPALQQLSCGLYRSTRHVLLVGDRGVGKTTLLHELARQAAAGELQHLSTARFLYVDGRQIPGGDGAAFLEALANTSSREPEAVWCLDHLRHFLKSDDGRWRTAPLATLVHRTPARIIGVLDRPEALELLSRDPDLFARFTLVELTEPQEPALLEILQQHVDRLSREFALEIPASLIPRCIALTSTFLFSELQPAKSIQLLQRVCEDLDFERSQAGIPHSQLREEHLAAGTDWMTHNRAAISFN